MSTGFRCKLHVVVTACLVLAGVSPLQGADRVPWVSSKLVGAPDPPLPYVLQRAFPVEFNGPISLNRLPNSPWFLVCEQHGKIYGFNSKAADMHSQLLVDFRQTQPPKSGIRAESGRSVDLFSLTFHPDFAENRWIYVCYVCNGGGEPATTHISRFRLATSQHDRPEIDVASEVEILTCEGGGHNGCTLAFGGDGCLYISIGDLESPTPPDPRETGQDISDLYSSILRIDVDHPAAGANYSVPNDNPFVSMPNARPEVYAYGFRNPFRMSFDHETGDLWVGDVGWEAWEMVYRVRSGGNYGWAIKEGPGDVKPQKQGPTPISPADIALGHAEAASVTGGMVYRGTQLPDLKGQYVFGDWITRKFWAATFDAKQVISYREIAVGAVKPICFETDLDGELLVMDYNQANQPSGIFRFVLNPALTGDQHTSFPRKLSETGLFVDTEIRSLAPGVVAYQLNAPMWRDGTVTENLVAIPGDGQANFFQQPQKTFDWFKTRVELPKGTVFAKTFVNRASPIETQIALKDEQGEWQYYTYRWDDTGADAQLVDAAGSQREIELVDHLGRAEKTLWQFGSRTSCRVCHTPWTGETIGFIESQLRNPSLATDSWRTLMDLGVAKSAGEAAPLADDVYLGLADPHQADQSLDRRARSYLHANCAHCHLFGGNASTGFDISFEKLLDDTKAIDATAMRGDLGLKNARIIAPGQPAESVLMYRMAKSGSGRMPHVGSTLSDLAGIRLVRQWIAQMPRSEQHRRWLDTLCAPRTAPGDDESRRRNAYMQLLDSAEGALELSGALAEGRVPNELVHDIVDAALQRSPTISELIEPYAAEDQRVQRLGIGFAPEAVLQLTGDFKRGQSLFVAGVGSCSGCHKIDGVGKNIGPDLSQISKKLNTREKILDSVMRPSAQIDEAYQATALLTEDGRVLTGRIIARASGVLQLQAADGTLTSLDEEEIIEEKKAMNSLMPEQLLANLTAQQAADLLEFLDTLGR
ncbi:MAG: PQQ-dependent sugar dehydrogenase [Planctomycetales bacterium]|nr:PQQ-dependent sugar dehydrogenase [Planctomycetales bacterium]